MKAGVSSVRSGQQVNSCYLFPVTVIENMPTEVGARYIALLDRSACHIAIIKMSA
jgi:hypothetical protein